MNRQRSLAPAQRWVGALCLAGAAAWLSAAETKPVDVRVTAPARGDVVRYVTLPANLRANQQATLYAKAAGYLSAIKVDKGDRVKSGDLLAEIEVPELLAEKIRWVAEFKRTQAEHLKAEAEEKLAAVDFDRVSKAIKQAPDLVVAHEVDAAQARLEVAKANQKSQEASEEVAKANLQRVQTLLDFAKITAPFNGLITARFVDPGAFIPAATSGSAAQNAAVVTIMDLDTVRVQIPVTELEAPLVAVGQPVKVSLESYPGKAPLEAKVSRLACALDETTRTMLVECDVPNPNHELRPGMYALTKLGVEKHTNVLTVPSEALVMEKVNAFVFQLDGSKAKKTAVKLGFNDGKNVEIADGLKGSEKILLPGKTVLNDGQAVNAVEAK